MSNDELLEKIKKEVVITVDIAKGTRGDAYAMHLADGFVRIRSLIINNTPIKNESL